MGGVFLSLSKKLNALLDVETRQACEHLPPAAKLRFILQQWTVGNKCCEHIAHKGFEWSMFPLVQHNAEQKLLDMHICCASLRTGFGQLQTALPSFVLSAITFREGRNDKKMVKEFWSIFSHLDPEAIDELAHLDIWFDGTCLLIDDEHALRDDLLEKVSTAMMAASKFRNYTDSRMRPQGQATSGVTASQCVGLDAWVGTAVIVANSDWHIKGYSKRMADDLRVYSAVATLVSRIGDEFILELFKDDRLLMHPEYQQHAVDNVRQLSMLDPFVYDRLAQGPCRGAITCVDLLDQTMMSANILGAYMWLRAFRIANQPPWVWAQGDVSANLLRVKDGPKPKNNLTAIKIWMMLQVGFDVDFVAEAVAALLQLSWCTHIIEQFHAGPGLMAKEHGRYNPETVLARALVYILNHMLQPEEDNKLEKLELQLERARARKCCQSAPGMFARDAASALGHIPIAADCEMLPRAVDEAGAHSGSRQFGRKGFGGLIPHFANLYRNASAGVRATYQAMAEDCRRSAQHAQEIEVKWRLKCIAQYHAEKETQEAGRSLFRSSASRFHQKRLSTSALRFKMAVGRASVSWKCVMPLNRFRRRPATPCGKFTTVSIALNSQMTSWALRPWRGPGLWQCSAHISGIALSCLGHMASMGLGCLRSACSAR